MTPNFFYHLKSDYAFSLINFCTSIGSFAQQIAFYNDFSLLSIFMLNYIVAIISHVWYAVDDPILKCWYVSLCVYIRSLLCNLYVITFKRSLSSNIYKYMWDDCNYLTSEVLLFRWAVMKSNIQPMNYWKMNYRKFLNNFEMG